MQSAGDSMEDWEGQEDIGGDKAAPELDLRFMGRVALIGLALHLAAFAADCPAAGDAAAAVFFAGWLFGVRNLGEDKAK